MVIRSFLILSYTRTSFEKTNLCLYVHFVFGHCILFVSGCSHLCTCVYVQYIQNIMTYKRNGLEKHICYTGKVLLEIVKIIGNIYLVILAPGDPIIQGTG
jgi:hypothetical protein